ncbi:MAG: GerMN domain-containing protein [Enterocloster sp.]
MVFLCSLLSGCEKTEKLKADPENGIYLIYYLNAAMTRLVPQSYEAQGSTREELVEELMKQFVTVPQDLDCQSALSDKVTYMGTRQDDQVQYIYFDVNYSSMKPDREILCRAALARMLTQIEGINYISVYCGEQPLMDLQGNPVGAVSAADFIMNTSNVNAYEKTELTLYFADETGNKLVPERREVVHNINTSLEQLIVEQLIAGPGQEGSFAVLPPDCKILSLSVTDNVCYINFDSSFLNNSLPVSEYVPIYAIVDSLSEMTSINRVQIMVNGSQDVMFRDLVSLNTTFERSQDYISSGNGRY